MSRRQLLKMTGHDFSAYVSRFLTSCSSAWSGSPGGRREAPFTVLVEGNIGSGKTTFLKQFMDSPEVDVVEEPVSKWQDLGGHNLIRLMYSEPARWSFAFQSYVQLTMLENHLAPPKRAHASLRLLERSIFSARYCFVENLRRSGVMPASEAEVLAAWFHHLTTAPHIHIPADLVIYLRTQPEVAWARLRRRDRAEEEAVSLGYLRDLHNLHEEWLIKEEFPVPGPVIVIDANKDLEGIKMEFLSQRDDILSKFHKEINADMLASESKENVSPELGENSGKRSFSDVDLYEVMNAKKVVLKSVNK